MQFSLTTILVLSSWSVVGDVPQEHSKLAPVTPLVGTWEGHGELPGGPGLVVPELVYEWKLDRRVIGFHSTTNAADGAALQKRMGMIFWDPSDEQVKMWVTDSTGGNIRARLTGVDGGEMSWDADAVLPDGRLVAFSFTISIPGDAKHTVRRGEVTFEFQRKGKDTSTDVVEPKAGE
jgi:hypothetical protein